MAISTEVFKNQYTANGVNTIFAYTFKIFDENEIAVLLDNTLKTITTHYTVSGVGVAGGGNITFVTAPTNGVTVTLKQNPDFTQEIEYVEGDDFSASSHEEGLDRSVIRDQALQEQMDRAVLLPASSTLSGVTLPDPEDGKVIGWTGVAGAMQNYDVDDLGGVPISSFGTVFVATSNASSGRSLLSLGTAALENIGALLNSPIASGDNVLDLGSSAKRWKDVYAAGNYYLAGLPISAVLLETSTASNSANVSFTGLNSTYHKYIVDISGLIPSGDGLDLWLRTSINSGSSYDSGVADYSWGYMSMPHGSPITQVTDASDSEIVLANDLGTDTNESGDYEVCIINPSATKFGKISYGGTWQNSGGAALTNKGGAMRNSSSPINAIQFSISSGNIESGIFKLYGEKA